MLYSILVYKYNIEYRYALYGVFWIGAIDTQ